MVETQVVRIRPSERVEVPPTGGMARFQAMASDRIWAGTARTDPGMVSDLPSSLL
jgi:hypothetical protein